MFLGLFGKFFFSFLFPYLITNKLFKLSMSTADNDEHPEPPPQTAVHRVGTGAPLK